MVALTASENTPFPPPPRAKGKFLLGSLTAFSSDPLKFLNDILAEHGDVVQFSVGPVLAHLIRHPKDVSRVLQDNHTGYAKHTHGYGKMKLLLGEGLVTSNGAFWLRQRRIAQPAFHRNRIAGFADAMTERTDQLRRRLDVAALDGTEVNLADEYGTCAMEIAGDTLLSVDMSGDAKAVAHALGVVLPYIDGIITSIVPFPDIWPTSKNREFKREAKVLDEVVGGVIDSRRKMSEANEELPNDLLTMLLEARDEDGEGMTNGQLRDEVMTMFLAGHETTANTLAWTTMLLSRHPEVMRKLQAEVDEVLGSPTGDTKPRRPKLEDLRSLPLLDRVVKEGLRMYPPAWMVGRSVEADDVVGGYAIPKGSVMFISPYLIHRHPDFWTNPEAFDPERFLPEKEAEIPRGAYVPFVAGPRQCIGKAFAEMELRLVLAMMVSSFDFNIRTGFEPLPDTKITMRLEGGLPVEVVSRASPRKERAA